MNSLRSTRRRRAFTLTEIMVSVAILAIVIGIVLPATVSYARTLKGLRQLQVMQKQVNLFMQRMEVELTSAQAISLINPNLVRLGSTQSNFVPDASEATGFRFVVNTVTVELEYLDADNNPNTIDNNRVVMRKIVRNPQNQIISSDEDTVLRWVTPSTNANNGTRFVFREVTGAARTTVEMLARIGDPTDPPSDAANAITGPGFQGYLIRQIFAPTNLPSL